MSLDAEGMFAPDKSATRSDAVRGLALMLTLSPDQNHVSLTGTLVPHGQVQINKSNGSTIEVTSASLCFEGDTIITDSNGTAELNFPDGSGIKIKENTWLTIKEARGYAYILQDGKPGTMIDMLALDLTQGEIFGALASNYHNDNWNNNEGDEEHSTAMLISDKRLLVASLNLPSVLAAGTKNAELPWYQNSSQKKVRVKVDMPWGVAAIRGTFWHNVVNQNGSGSTSVLTGECQVTAGGQTVIIPPGQFTAISGVLSPPSPPVPMSPQHLQQWNGEYQWFLKMVNNMQNSSPLQPGPPPSQPGPGTPPGGIATEMLNSIHQTTPQFGALPPPVRPSSGRGPSNPSVNRVAAPTASPAPGTYNAVQSVSLSCATPGASIYYTTDGSDPTNSETRMLYSEPVYVATTAAIKALAVKSNLTDSEVKTFSYVIDLDSAAVEADKNTLQIGFAGSDSQSSVTQNINLPLTGTNGSVIAWSSSNETAVSLTGTITRTDTAQEVTLTATIRKGNASTAKTFDLTVMAAETADNYGRSYPVMAYDPDNNRYLMVYFKHDLAIRDYNLYGRLVAANSDYIGSEFPIRISQEYSNSSYDYKPDVAYDSINKVFLVVWNEGALTESKLCWDIYGQIISVNGEMIGDAFAITSLNDEKNQITPYLDFDNINNRFLVAYKHNVSDTSYHDDIHGRFINIVDGNPVVGEDMEIYTHSNYSQSLSDVVFNGEDKFMVPINSYRYCSLMAVNAVAGEVSEPYYFGSTANRPSLAFDNVNQRILAVWDSGVRVYGGFINQDGTKDGEPFQINDESNDEPWNVSVAYAGGSFYVAWEHEKYYDYNNSYINILAKNIDATTGEMSNQIEVTTGANQAKYPFVCGSDSGALVAWTEEGDGVPDVIRLHYLASPVALASFTAAPQAADIILPADITVNLTVDKAATAYYAVVQEDNLGFNTPAPIAQQLNGLFFCEGGWVNHYGVVPVLAAGRQSLSGQATGETDRNQP